MFQQHQTRARTVAITNDFGFGQKGHIVKITAISGFASSDVQDLTVMALRAHAFIHHIETACWVFLLVHHGGEKARQYQWRTDFEMAWPITLGQARELLTGVRVVYGRLRDPRSKAGPRRCSTNWGQVASKHHRNTALYGGDRCAWDRLAARQNAPAALTGWSWAARPIGRKRRERARPRFGPCCARRSWWA